MEQNLIPSQSTHTASGYEDGVCSLEERMSKNWINTRCKPKRISDEIMKKLKENSSKEIKVTVIKL